MCRLRSLSAEVVAGFDDAAAEHLLPGAVDGHPRAEWVLGRDDPLRQAQAISWLIRGKRREECGRVCGYRFAWRVVSAALENERGLGLGVLLHHHHFGN